MRPLARGTGASKPVFSFVKVLLDRVRTYVCIRVQFDLTLCSVKCTPILLSFSRYVHRACIYVYICMCVRLQLPLKSYVCIVERVSAPLTGNTSATLWSLWKAL